MRAKAMPGEDPTTLPMPATIAPQIVDLIEPACAAHGTIVDLKAGSSQPL